MYFVIFINYFSRKVWVYFIRHKSETFVEFKLWKAKVENETRKKVKCLCLLKGVKMCKLDFFKFCVLGKQNRVQFKTATYKT